MEHKEEKEIKGKKVNLVKDNKKLINFVLKELVLNYF